ncbi:Crp/Fnr family transcriptional regulator [Marinovum sp.]|uniref:Crp/Fnr family transcriptional regulator n=1 Tax=Marinovum sp. TaxID=2024839 RepID=UPI002B26B478|nr:Crp/Fnr family transcriptional regulator [Marinovum sp.]
MATDCRTCPLRKWPIFDPLTEAEISFMETFKSGELAITGGATLMMEGSNSPQLFTVLEGMGLRYKTLPTGERQVINFVFPGDFLGLQAGVMSEMQHSVEATTPMRLCVFDRKSLWSLFEGHPDRAFDLTWIAAVEEHLLGESLAIIGRMSGLERIARAFVRLYERGTAQGLVKDNEMPLPYKQHDLADALGLSLVHTNKMLTRLRELGFASWQGGRLKVLDYAALCELAQLESDRAQVTRPLI